ncbi:MAG: ABC transporter substrate-binding protein [Thermoprotei archaeon]|nr:MAG: ABC transporter substrate-binding protein [Thermoprotei archaeon]
MKAQITKLAIVAIITFIIGIAVGYGIGLATITPPPPKTITKTVTVTTTSPATVTVAPVTLTVVGPWAGAEMEAFMEVLKAFEKEHPNIKLEYKIYRAEDLASIAPPQFAAGMAPGDVIFTAWGWWVKKMGEQGHLYDLSKLVNTNEFVKGIFDPVKSGDKIYGLPFTAWAKPGFWYRKSFFEKHGLTPPKSWDEFLKLLDKLKEILNGPPIVTGNGVGWPISDVTEHFIITFGGPELQLKLIKGEVKFTDPEAREVFEKYLVPLIKKGYFSEPIEWTRAIELWWQGKYALYFMGTWLTGMVKDPTDLGFFPLPGCKGVVMGTDYIIVPKYTKHPKEALELAKWLATEGQRVHVGTKAGKFATWLKVGIEDHWKPMQEVYAKLKDKVPLPDLDDSVGGDWQKLFWDQLKLLWVSPDKLNQVLETLTANFPKK